MLLTVVNFIFTLIMVMLSIAFFTLMERKIIGYSQTRKGPNKTLIIGIIQPIADAIKLLAKEVNMNQKSNTATYFLSPTMNILCSFLMWITFPFTFTFSFMKMSILFMLSCMAFNTITIMLMSWSSNSNYAFIGMMRTISQMISYEINFMMMILVVMLVNEQLTIYAKSMIKVTMPTVIWTMPLVIIWLIVILAETNRTPFDFSEGESELISGFNIEYSSISFMMLFLSEYSSILFMSFVTVTMFYGLSPSSYSFLISFSSLCFLFIWSRTTLPRFRYDKLMKLNWTKILPMTTFILFILFPFKM